MRKDNGLELYCPYCGYKYDGAWELREDESTVTCGDCEREFAYVRDVVCYYSSYKIEPPDGLLDTI